MLQRDLGGIATLCSSSTKSSLILPPYVRCRDQFLEVRFSLSLTGYLAFDSEKTSAVEWKRWDAWRRNLYDTQGRSHYRVSDACSVSGWNRRLMSDDCRTDWGWWSLVVLDLFYAKISVRTRLEECERNYSNVPLGELDSIRRGDQEH